jgi:hypothetical protein
VRLRGAWQSILEGSRAVGNFERMALAESKVSECQSEISRIETLLEHAHGAT